MKNLTYELFPRNGVFGDADLQIDGYAVKLIVRFVIAGEERKKIFVFQNCKSLKFEAQSWIKRPIPGLLNQIEHIATEAGSMYRSLCEDFGYFEVISDEFFVEEG